MSRSRRLLLAVALLAALPLALLGHPRVRAALRLAAGFYAMADEPRVFMEEGSGDMARAVADALDEAVARVEAGHGQAFTRPFRVYVCASVESFASRLALPSDSPVRGLALYRDVWISPRAFDFAGRDTHAQSLAHELSHLHLDQHLGIWRRSRNVPGWLAEGLADVVAGTGFETVTPAQAREAILSGHDLAPSLPGGPIWSRGWAKDRLSWPMRHAQSRLFVGYLQARDAGAFGRGLAAVLAGEPTGAALSDSYHRHLPGLWSDFVSSLGPAIDEDRGGIP